MSGTATDRSDETAELATTPVVAALPSAELVVPAGPTLMGPDVPGMLGRVDRSRATAASDARVVVDLGGVDRFDSAGLAGLVELLRRGEERGFEVRLRGVSAGMLDLLSLVSLERLTRPAVVPVRDGAVSAIGRRMLPQLEALGRVARVGTAVLGAVLVDPFRGRAPRLDRTARELDEAAVGALPIALWIAFLLGLILALQAWAQLRVWSAELYMANMVGVSIVTEIGPLMTAIILAARTGSSDAARLGAMVVAEEVDALSQMGIEPVRYLVVPKVLASALAAVAVGILFSATALVGGALFAWSVADIGPALFRGQLEKALSAGDLWFACGKSIAFGGVVGVVACAEGLGVTGGSEGVGRATTRAVVLAVLGVVLVDAAFVASQRFLFA